MSDKDVKKREVYEKLKRNLKNVRFTELGKAAELFGGLGVRVGKVVTLYMLMKASGKF